MRKNKNKKHKIIRDELIGFIIAIILLTVTNNIIKEKWDYHTYVPEGYNILYHPYEVQYGDTLNEIVSDWLQEKPETGDNIPFKIEKVEVMKITNIKNPDRLKAGEVIFLPYLQLKED